MSILNHTSNKTIDIVQTKLIKKISICIENHKLIVWLHYVACTVKILFDKKFSFTFLYSPVLKCTSELSMFYKIAVTTFEEIIFFKWQ